MQINLSVGLFLWWQFLGYDLYVLDGDFFMPSGILVIRESIKQIKISHQCHWSRYKPTNSFLASSPVPVEGNIPEIFPPNFLFKEISDNGDLFMANLIIVIHLVILQKSKGEEGWGWLNQSSCGSGNAFDVFILRSKGRNSGIQGETWWWGICLCFQRNCRRCTRLQKGGWIKQVKGCRSF